MNTDLAKSNAERQKAFRESRTSTHKKLEVWLPNDEAKLLHDNAKNKGLTKAEYVASLLPDNDNQDEVALLRAHLETARANVARLEHENKHLISGTRFKDIPPLGKPS